MLFPAIAFIVWAVYTWAISGKIGSTGVSLLMNADQGLVPFGRFGQLWSGYLSQLLGGSSIYTALISIVSIITGAVVLLRRKRSAIIPLVFFPLFILYFYGAYVTHGSGPWDFWGQRRYVDPALPVLIALTLIGLVYLVEQTIKIVQGRIHPTVMKLWIPVIIIIIAVLVVSPFGFGLLKAWPTRQREYIQNIAGIERTYAAPARFLAAHAQKNGVVAVGLGGAASYFTNMPIIEFTGTQEPKYFGVPGYDILAVTKPDYFIAFKDDKYAASIPNAVDISQGQLDGPMKVMAYNWSWTPSDPTVPGSITPGYRVVDQFGVTDKAAAKAHNYDCQMVAFDPYIASITSDGRKLIDHGLFRRAPGNEQMTMAAKPSQPARLIVRYDGIMGGIANVYIDGNDAGQWALPTTDYALNEATFDIPAKMVTSSDLSVRLEWQGNVTTFRFWLVQE